MKTLSKVEEYVIPSRRISGTHVEKLDQIDQAVQELLDIKLLECAGDQPNVHFLAAPRRTHWFAMTMGILVMLTLLVLLLWERPGRTRNAVANPTALPSVAGGIRFNTERAPVPLPQRIDC